MTTCTKRLFATLLGMGILFAADFPAHAQNALLPLGKALSSKVVASDAVGQRALNFLKSTKGMAALERQLFSQVVAKSYFPGYYRPDLNVNTQTIAYLRSVQKGLDTLYPQTEYRFAPVTVSSFDDLMYIWNHGPKEAFMEARNAVSLIVERTAARRVGFYAVAVQNAPGSAFPVKDILILDVNNGRWISMRKSLESAHRKTIQK